MYARKNRRQTDRTLFGKGKKGGKLGHGGEEMGFVRVVAVPDRTGNPSPQSFYSTLVTESLRSESKLKSIYTYTLLITNTPISCN